MKLRHLLCLLALLVLTFGCGGSSSGGPGPNVGNGSLFATDSLSDAAHVWVTIDNVTLQKAGGGTVVVFDDPNGLTIDLVTLQDATGQRFGFISTIPTGTFTGIAIKVAKDLIIFPQGSSTGEVRQFAGNDGTSATLTSTFSPPVTIQQNQPVVIDFNLSTWTDNGTTVTGAPFIRLGTTTGINDPNRHDRDDMEGAVTQLAGTAPTQTFVLVRGHNHINVTVNAQTRLLRSDGAMTPVLQNGQQVTVHGAFDVTANAVIADWVEIHGQGTPHNHGIHGSLVSSDPIAGTFVLAVDHIEGFLPEHTQVNVTTSQSTIYQTDGGRTITYTDFFLGLQPGVEVRVTGDYDANTNTIAAATARLDSDEQGGDHSEVRGPISNINAGAHTFDVTATDWEGLNLPPNTIVHVTVSDSTVLRLNGSHLNVGDFFTQIAAGQTASVDGVYDFNTSTMAATEVSVTSQ